MSEGTTDAVVDGKLVIFHYDMCDKDGQSLETTRDGDPVVYIHGAGQLALSGLESALAGKVAGNSFELTLEPEDAYGVRDPDGYIDMPKDAFPDENIEVGHPFFAENEAGEPVSVWVAEVRDDAVQVTLNHPLAGAKLTFSLEVVEVRDPTEEEMEALEVF